MNSPYNSLVTRVLLMVVLVFIAASCTPRKKLIYFQNADAQTSPDTIIVGIDTFNYRLQAKDILYISIRGLDEKTTTTISGTSDRGIQPNDVGVYLSSHTIDDGGCVILPLVGAIKVTGLTLEEARKILQIEVEKYIRDPWVNLKLAYFKVTVLGEVARPGVFKVYEHEVTLLEAIGYAGDLTLYGDRQEILIIREDAKQNKTLGYVDISKREFLTSEFYHLMPNDVVYIKSYPAKNYGLKEFPWLSIVSTTASLVSTAVTLYVFSITLKAN